MAMNHELTPEFVQDLKDTFARHGWAGHPIGFQPLASATMVVAADCDTGPDFCPSGTTEDFVWVNCPDGVVRQKRICT